jgi:hypothetical protein
MKLTQRQRTALRMKFGGFCAYCGCELGPRWHADHVKAVERVLVVDEAARRQFGVWRLKQTGEVHRPHLDTVDNLFPACAPCNLYKGVFSVEEFRRQLQNMADVLARSNGTFRNAVRFGLVQVAPAAPLVFHFERWSAAQAVCDPVQVATLQQSCCTPAPPSRA